MCVCCVRAPCVCAYVCASAFEADDGAVRLHPSVPVAQGCVHHAIACGVDIVAA